MLLISYTFKPVRRTLVVDVRPMVLIAALVWVGVGVMDGVGVGVRKEVTVGVGVGEGEGGRK